MYQARAWLEDPALTPRPSPPQSHVQCLSWSAWDWRWPPLQVSVLPAWVLSKPSQLPTQTSHLPGEREAFLGNHHLQGPLVLSCLFLSTLGVSSAIFFVPGILLLVPGGKIDKRVGAWVGWGGARHPY